jgi:hypothetical protein
LFVFHGASDGGGDVAGKKFSVLPELPHRFWLKAAGVGALSIWGLKECPDGPGVVSVFPDVWPKGYSEENWAALHRLMAETADKNFTIVDMKVISLVINDCNNFDAKAAALGIGFGAGVGAGGVSATLLTALGGGAGAGGLFGAAGSITAGGVLAATGVGLVVLIVVAVVMWFILKKDCCQLGVDPSEKGTQGSLVGP